MAELLKLAAYKSFISVNKALSDWERVCKSGLELVKEISVLWETLQSCLQANVDETNVVRAHPDIKERLLLKLECDIEIERSKLTKISHQLGTISNRISNESSSVYTLYSKLIDNQEINPDYLDVKTETTPSLSQMILWLADIDREIESAYVVRKFVTETTNFRESKEHKVFIDSWNNTDYLPIVNEIQSYTQFFIKSVP